MKNFRRDEGATPHSPAWAVYGPTPIWACSVRATTALLDSLPPSGWMFPHPPNQNRNSEISSKFWNVIEILKKAWWWCRPPWWGCWPSWWGCWPPWWWCRPPWGWWGPQKHCWGVIKDQRLEIRKCDGLTNQLTYLLSGVGARDTCVSKNGEGKGLLAAKTFLKTSCC